MQFLAQVSLADAEAGSAGLLSIFMCQNDPGMCDEWDATAGGTRAFTFGADAVHVATWPGDGIALLEETCAVRFEEFDTDDYLEAPERWHQQTDRPAREVLGQVGGQPAWLQNDETPLCGGCAQPMTFVVQLEEGHDHQTSMNFGGGGCGYGFRCGPCGLPRSSGNAEPRRRMHGQTGVPVVPSPPAQRYESGFGSSRRCTKRDDCRPSRTNGGRSVQPIMNVRRLICQDCRRRDYAPGCDLRCGHSGL